jgi:hypothetical protein
MGKASYNDSPAAKCCLFFCFKNHSQTNMWGLVSCILRYSKEHDFYRCVHLVATVAVDFSDFRGERKTDDGIDTLDYRQPESRDERVVLSIESFKKIELGEVSLNIIQKRIFGMVQIDKLAQS